jgi:2,3-bisphosphoglycerate-dependent phosphoglycerate mutase
MLLMRHLHLVRHAQTQPTPDLPPPEWPLTAEGHVQARYLAAQISGLSVKRVVTSREPKAIETGRVIAEHLHLPIMLREGLQEHGRLTAQHAPTVEAFHENMRHFFACPGERVFGDESAVAARMRFEHAINQVMSEETGDELIVSHGTVISLLIAHANQLDAFEFWRKVAMPDYLVLEWPSFRLLTQR